MNSCGNPQPKPSASEPLADMFFPAEKAGKAINEGIDQVFGQVTNQVIAAATGFENKYLLCQAAECQAFRSEGMAQHDGIFIPLLKEVFVPLELDSSVIQAGFQALERS